MSKKGRYGSKSNPIVISDAQVARVMNRRTGGFVGLETKFFDSARSSVFLPSPANAEGGEVDPATILSLNCPAQGNGEQNRDGRVISMKSINVKGMITMTHQTDQTVLDKVPDIFIALVLDRQTNGAQLNSEDVFTNPSGQSVLCTQPFLNLENNERFQILATSRISSKDIAGAIQPTYDGANLEVQGAHVPFSMYKDLKGMRVNFINGQTTSTIAAIADRSLHVIAYASDTSLFPAIQYNSRLRFTG